VKGSCTSALGRWAVPDSGEIALFDARTRLHRPAQEGRQATAPHPTGLLGSSGGSADDATGVEADGNVDPADALNALNGTTLGILHRR
jgi:hypothetical protein